MDGGVVDADFVVSVASDAVDAVGVADAVAVEVVVDEVTDGGGVVEVPMLSMKRESLIPKNFRSAPAVSTRKPWMGWLTPKVAALTTVIQ